jgi:hypothetical protein
MSLRGVGSGWGCLTWGGTRIELHHTFPSNFVNFNSTWSRKSDFKLWTKMLSRIKKAVGQAVASVEDAVSSTDTDAAVRPYPTVLPDPHTYVDRSVWCVCVCVCVCIWSVCEYVWA